MDILSDVLHSLHLSGSLWCRTEARAPWSMKFDKMEVAQFHFVQRGSSWFQMDGMADPLLMATGDLIVLPHGNAHLLSDHKDTPAVSLEELKTKLKPGENGPLVIGGNGSPTTLLCGYFEFDHGEVHSLLSILPPFIYIKGEEGRLVPWLETTLNFIYSESNSELPGNQTIITRLADILFIQIIRQHIESPLGKCTGWLAGLKDPQIGKALELIHRNPEKAWDLNLLSATVGMSRASFSSKFKQLVGESPFRYLTRWRMHKAANYLKNPISSLSEAAEKSGYESEAAFSKTFKRFLGMGPGKYRHRHQLGN